MKIFITVAMLFVMATAFAQQSPSFRVNGYAGYFFSDHVSSYYSSTSYYDGTVNGNLQWGVGLEYMLRKNQGLELTYLREDTKAPTSYWDGIKRTKDFDLNVNCILIGGTRYLQRSEMFEPYFGGQIGIGIIGVSNPTSGNSSTSTKFAWALKGGSNIWFSKSAGLKLQAGLLSVAQAVGGGLYFGTGGVGTGVSTYSTVLQFTLGGGIVFRFGGDAKTAHH